MEGNYSSYSNSEFRISIDDPPAEENYYEISAFQTCYWEYEDFYGELVQDSFEQNIHFERESSNNPNFVKGYNSEAILMSDFNF